MAIKRYTRAAPHEAAQARIEKRPTKSHAEERMSIEAGRALLRENDELQRENAILRDAEQKQGREPLIKRINELEQWLTEEEVKSAEHAEFIGLIQTIMEKAQRYPHEMPSMVEEIREIVAAYLAGIQAERGKGRATNDT